MDRRATKDRYERETEETERLVRQSPKVKPPRRDLRRETIEPDTDPDLDTTDKKADIGTRVFDRWAGLFEPKKDKAPSKKALPKPPKPAGKGTAPPPAPSKKVKVKSKETGWVGWITPDQLKEHSSDYETVSADEEAPKTESKPKPESEPEGKAEKKKKKPAKESEPPAPPKSDPKPKDEDKPKDEGKAPAQGADDAANKAKLNEMVKSDPKFASFVKSMMDPAGTVYQMAKGKSEFSNPNYPIANLLKGYTLPESIKTVSDFVRVMETPDPVKPEAGKGKEKGKGKGTGKGKPAPDAPPAYEYKEAPPAPGTPTRPVSKLDRERAFNLISQALPSEYGAKLLSMNPPLHPDEVVELVRDYNTAKSVKVPNDKLPDFVAKASKFFASTPDEVKSVPKDLDSLPPDQQAAALRKHQIKTVAMSIAASDAVASNLQSNTGAPKDLAESLGKFMLSSASKPPRQRMEAASQEAENLFNKRVDLDSHEFNPISKSEVRKILSSTKDPAVRKLAVGYFQAQDYQDARKLFLDAQSKDHVSEHKSPREIASGLSKATDFLRKRAESYPADSVGPDVAVRFRDKVVKHLTKLMPGDKLGEVQDLLDEQDNKHYDKTLKTFWRDTKKYESTKAKVEQAVAKDQAAYQAALKKGIKADPPKSAEERLYEAGIDEPKEPMKPVNYDVKRKHPKELAQDADSMWSDFESRTARILNRYKVAFSTYRDTFAMGNRKAVYWGVDPYPRGGEPYADWQQPQARDLGDADFSRLLKAARKWLSAPVLSGKIEGIVRDTQLRAALDLAVRSEGYGSTLHPSIYDDLLARLAGVPEDETLLTVTASNTRKTMSNKVELEIAQADKILKRLDKMAATIEAKHEEWGMPFKLAKSIVNAIDKTADELEQATYGSDSMLTRQASVLGVKTAEVLQRDSDEPYMDTFKNPAKPHQTDGDEPYMQAYADDDSSDVRNGKASNGRALAPK